MIRTAVFALSFLTILKLISVCLFGRDQLVKIIRYMFVTLFHRWDLISEWDNFRQL